LLINSQKYDITRIFEFKSFNDSNMHLFAYRENYF